MAIKGVRHFPRNGSLQSKVPNWTGDFPVVMMATTHRNRARDNFQLRN